ncbi:MAG: DUF721 domain-containing protein [Thiobacillus sp.]
MSAESLAELLARQLPASVAARAQALLKLQSTLDRALPVALAGHVRVRALDAGVLSLACASGALASRLRHQTDTLVSALASRGVPVDAVRVVVDPALHAPYTPPLDKPGLPVAALNGLARLETGIEDGPLKVALKRLLRHHQPDQ